VSTGQPDKLVIWRIYDKRAGHDNQSLGLVNALADQASLDCHGIPAPSFLQSLSYFLLKRFPVGPEMPDPDLIIGAGHKTHLPMLAARRARGGKTVVIMRPTLPTDWFDICLVPDHDKPTIKDNVFITHGALNAIAPASDHDPARGLILVGGPSRHYDWNTDQLMEQITTIIRKTPEIHWLISDSARTPTETRERLAKSVVSDNARFVPHTDTSDEWVGEQLQECATVWVTADSISMIYESLTAGACTGILPVPYLKENKITNVVNDLNRAKMIVRYQDWLTGESARLPPGNFNEARRSAAEVLKRFRT